MQNGKRFDVTGFGESMLRLSVPTGSRLAKMSGLDVHLAGAESNVLAALSCLGHKCGWVGGLPDNDIGRFAERELRAAGIDCQPVFVHSGRLGAYYVEFASPPRSTNVIYDRANSAVTQLTPDQIDYDYLLDTQIIHLTGITPALSAGCLAITQTLIEKAKAVGVKVSFDVNYRSKLWTTTEAAATLLPLIQEVDFLSCNQRDAIELFGCNAKAESVIAGARQVIEQLADKTKANQIVVSIGEHGVVGWDGVNILHEHAQPVEIIDRLGAGDAMAAGNLHGVLNKSLLTGVRYGAILSGLALSQNGDMVETTLVEIEDLISHGSDHTNSRLLIR